MNTFKYIFYNRRTAKESLAFLYLMGVAAVATYALMEKVQW